MKLTKFVKMKKPWEYNFEFEDEKFSEEFKSGEDTFERYFTYKASALEYSSIGVYQDAEAFIKAIENEYSETFDCDACTLATEIYSALWSNCELVGDTLNSVHKRLVGLVQYFKDNQKAELEGNLDSRKYLTQCYKGENHEAFLKRLKSIGGLKDYIDSYHKLGNFVLVPNGFNPYRASKFNDYWESSLGCLRVTQIKGNSFAWYINYFFLWDYVEIDNGEYKERAISPRKDLLKEYEYFFAETTKLIERRGKFMSAMLMLPESDYQKIQNEIFSTSEIYKKGFDDVIPLIKDKISPDKPVKDILDGLTD